MKRLFSRSAIALTLTLGTLLLVLVGIVLFILQQHQMAQSQLADLEPRYARLLGLQASRTDLVRAETEASALLARYAYPSTQDVSQAGNDAQQRVRAVFSGAGLEIASSQVLPPKEDKFFDRIPLTVRMEGELVALQSALMVLSSQSPAIIVDGFTVQTIGFVKADIPQKLAVQFNMSVLRTRP